MNSSKLNGKAADMHSTEREKLILEAVRANGFVSYRDLEAALDASPATIRRDLARLEAEEKLVRVHGGAKTANEDEEPARGGFGLKGTPFDTSLHHNLAAKRAIGRAAAALVGPGEGIIIDGGTTTYQMCEHLGGRGLQVLTNSLHIVNALLPLADTQLLVPSGTIFREQNIILAPSGEHSMPDFHATRLFIGAAAISPRGIFQPDAVLVASQRRLLDHADQIVLMADSSKLALTSGAIVCPVNRIDLLITDAGANPEHLRQLQDAGLAHVIIAE